MRRRWFVSTLALAAAFAGCSQDAAPASSSSAPTTTGDLARGAYLLTSLIDCGGCHTSDPTKPFGGGTQFPIDGQGHYVYSRNLTSDPSTGLQLTEDQFVTVLQTGQDFRNPGQMLFVMPWPNFRWMTVDDLKAIYAFLQVLPQVNNAVPPDNKGPLAMQGPVPRPTEYDEGEETRALPPLSSPDPIGPPGASTDTPDPGNAVRGGAILPLAYEKMPNFYARTAEEQASFGRGSYLVNAALCGECHTNVNGSSRNWTPGAGFLDVYTDAYLTGGTTFSVPGPLNPVLGETRTMSANLIGKSGYFNEPAVTFLAFASEIDALAHTDDNPPLPLGWPMPADHFRNLSPGDLEDIYTYMKILAEDYKSTTQVDKVTQDQARYCTSSSDCEPGETCFVDGASPPVVNNQCLPPSCSVDADCDACQTCANGACQAPSPTSACLTQGL